LFPAVFGIEAMTQAVSALAILGDDSSHAPAAGRLVLEDVEFRRPIVVTPGSSTGIRVAALNRGGSADVVIRCGDTSFAVDHFSATLRWLSEEQPDPELSSTDAGTTGSGRAAGSGRAGLRSDLPSV